MITRDEIIEIGVYNKAHGVKGEISATLMCEVEDFKRFTCVISDIDGIFVPFFIVNLRPKTSETVLLTIDGFESDVEVKTLVNKVIYVRKSEYMSLSTEEDCDEFPLDYFIGYTVKDVNGSEIGEIIDVDDTTDNVLFIVDYNGKEASLPAVDELIVDIDQESQILEYNLPIGLLDL